MWVHLTLMFEVCSLFIHHVDVLLICKDVSDSCLTWGCSVRAEDLLTLVTLLLSWAEKWSQYVYAWVLSFVTSSCLKDPAIGLSLGGNLMRCHQFFEQVLMEESKPYLPLFSLWFHQHWTFKEIYPNMLKCWYMKAWWSWISPVEFSSALWCGHGPFESLLKIANSLVWLILTQLRYKPFKHVF